MNKLKKTFIGLGILGIAYFANVVFNWSLYIREYNALESIPKYKSYQEKKTPLLREGLAYENLIMKIDEFREGMKSYERLLMEIDSNLKIPEAKSIEDTLIHKRRNALEQLTKTNKEIQSLMDEILQDPEVCQYNRTIATYMNRVFNPFYSGSEKQKK